MCGIDFSTCDNCDFVHSILAKGFNFIFVSSDKSAENHGSLEPMKTSGVTCCKLPLWDGNRMASLACVEAFPTATSSLYLAHENYVPL